MLGFDIGGANTKAVLIRRDNAQTPLVLVASQYFPFWKHSHKLPEILISLKNRLGADSLDALGVTMTAELSDAYQTKREGVQHILGCVRTAFPEISTYVLNTNAELFTINAAQAEPLRVAAANWAATGWVVSRKLSNALVVDVGSTSTSIIPIVAGKVAAQGKTDIEKLVCGELVYTGCLRTNVAAIVQSIPVKGGVASVSSELFALSGDIHLLLGHISPADYTSETADGRGKTVSEALARLARVVCADTDMLTEAEITDMARYVYGKQVSQVASGIKKSYAYVKAKTCLRVPVVVTGLGKDFLARKAAEIVGVDEIVDLDSILISKAVYATPAAGTAAMVYNKIAGGLPEWI